MVDRRNGQLPKTGVANKVVCPGLEGVKLQMTKTDVVNDCNTSLINPLNRQAQQAWADMDDLYRFPSSIHMDWQARFGGDTLVR
jgi:hypothetical protein